MLLPTKDMILLHKILTILHKMTAPPFKGRNVTQENQMSGGLLFLEYKPIMFVCCLNLYFRLKT